MDTGLIVLDSRSAGGRRGNHWMAAASGIPAGQRPLAVQLPEIFPDMPPNQRLLAVIADALSCGTSGILVLFIARTDSSISPPGQARDCFYIISPCGRSGPGPSHCCLIQVMDVTVVTERDRLLRERQNARYDAVVD